jgi:hypothetical protein
MQYIPPTQKNIWRLALFYIEIVIFESFLYDPSRPIRRILHKILPLVKSLKNLNLLYRLHLTIIN